MSKVVRQNFPGFPKVPNKSSYPDNKSHRGGDYATCKGERKEYAPLPKRSSTEYASKKGGSGSYATSKGARKDYC